MVLLPKEVVTNGQNGDLIGKEVVISGISGIFPNSNNVSEFMENLYNKMDMVTEDVSSFDHAELPTRSGKITGINKFDAHFFRVTPMQARSMDPKCRKLMEQAYSAIFDAGINPVDLKGKKVGVFTSTNYGKTSMDSALTLKTRNNFLLTGVSKTMLANRISYWLDVNGPSYNIDNRLGSTACLEHAYDCIKTGICDAAIVGGAEFDNNDVASINLRYAGLVSLDGKTRCFDKNGDGYVRSQAVGVIFLQKAKDAKRIYAELCDVRTQYGLKQGANFNQTRETEAIVDFLKHIYNDIGVSPDEVEYVEANGAAYPEADSNELQAIAQVFAENKTVKVGCVKSNMGNSESFSGICAVTKLCLAYHKGKIAGNLHYNDPLDIPAVKEHKIEVLTETTSFKRGFAAINSFPFDGTDSHIVLKGHFKPKNTNIYKSELPRLVLVAGRHSNGLENMFNVLKTKSLDPEFLGMLNNIYQIDTPGFTCRGYAILDTIEGHTASLAQSSQVYQGTRRPLWFVYSGMGSQWTSMGAELMRIPLFAAAIEKCHKVLEPKGVDIFRILTAPDKTIFDNALNSFVGIAAVQIGLTDIFKEMGLLPDFIIGHSLGEMGCAYCDGCFSLEEMMLAAYARGAVSTGCETIKGLMAAVGLGYEDMRQLCPPEIDIACHNSFEFCTISGPEDVMKTFIEELKAKGVFVKEVPSGNIAYHSRYIQVAGPELLKQLKNIIKNPVKRSEKWLCTSFPEEKLGDPVAQLSSAEYHTNNLLSPVYFEEAARQIPNDAVVVEIGPHSLMQAILKRSHPKCTYIPITRRAHENPVQFLFEAFGQLHLEGYNLKVDVLYPQIEYPVSTETDLLSHLAEWYHEDDWFSFDYVKNMRIEKVSTPSRTMFISMQDDDYKYLAGHVREGHIVFPEAAVLFYIWETLAMYKEVDYKEMSVHFQDVRFHAEVIVGLTETANLKISINKGNQYFEVTKDDSLVADGKVILLEQESNFELDEIENDKNDIQLVSDDIYKTMKLKGHCYQNEFQSIYSSNSRWNFSKIISSSHWMTFLDSLIQLNILRRNHEGLSIPKIIKELIIDVTAHEERLKMGEGPHKLLNAKFCKTTASIVCGGVIMKHVIFDNKPITEHAPDVLKAISLGLYDSKELNEEDNYYVSNNTIDYKLIRTASEDIKSLQWMETETDMDKSWKVYFAGTSIKDVQNYIGLLEPNRDFGMDFSGVDNKGSRVMGLVSGGALASRVEPNQDLLWPVPEHWSLEEAATVPLPYVHAFYCLTIKYHLRPGQSVLVTGGAGALGQAVIAICLSLRCTVYTCVSDIRKKQFLTRLFPDLNENNIGYSGDISFCKMVAYNSQNKLCDVAINCASGHQREFVMKCVGNFAYLLDVSNYKVKRNENFNMGYLEKDKTYTSVDLSTLFRPENADERKLLQRVVTEGIANGIVRPITHVVYPAEDVDRAFRLLSLGRHRGRALIKFSDSDALKIIPRLSYSSNGTYIVACDEQIEQGIQLANHLVGRGARNLILHVQSEKYPGFIKVQIISWKNLGVNVTVTTKNLEIKKNCVDILKRATKISGIFIISPKMGTNNNQDIENINRITTVVDNLNNASRNNCPKLKYFVILANKSGDIVDQTTLRLQDICEKRVLIGLPALILLNDFLNEPEQINGNVGDVQPMTIKTAIKAMEMSLKQSYVSAIAFNKNQKNPMIVDIVGSIMGIKHIETLDENLRIKDLLSYDINFEEIKEAIKEFCKLDLSTEYVKEMSIKSLKSLNRSDKKIETKFDKKLSAFYNFVDHDVIDATEIFVPMLTMTSWNEGEENLSAKATNLLLIPGFEGHHYMFKPLCEKIKMRATTLQFGPDVCNNSIQDIALNLKQHIVRRFTVEPKFYLLGYSFGVNVALEVAALLEKDGFVGVVYCLDSSPDSVRAQLEASLENLTEEQIQNAVIKHLYHLMSGKHCDKLENYIQNVNNWAEKVDKCVNELKGHVNYSSEYKTDVIEAFYNRIKLAKSYYPTFVLESKIILVKGVSHPVVSGLSADYCLSKYARNPVEVLEINSDFASAPYDSGVASFVNRFLDPVLLEEFKTNNACERYSK